MNMQKNWCMEKEKRIMKKNNKYNYIKGIQITDPDSGNRVYDFQGTRLPSVTTVLAQTKNQQFFGPWDAPRIRFL